MYIYVYLARLVHRRLATTTRDRWHQLIFVSRPRIRIYVRIYLYGSGAFFLIFFTRRGHECDIFMCRLGKLLRLALVLPFFFCRSLFCIALQYIFFLTFWHFCVIRSSIHENAEFVFQFGKAEPRLSIEYLALIRNISHKELSNRY